MRKNVILWTAWTLVLLSLATLATFLPRKQDTDYSPPDATADYQRVVRDGSPVVAAIIRFKSEYGLWPQTLDQLVPEYLSSRTELLGWRYYWSCTGQWTLVCYCDFPDTAVRFRFDSQNNTGQWSKWDGFEDFSLPSEQPTPMPSERTDSDIHDRIIAEFQRRIDRAPNEILHYQGLITWCHRWRDLQRASTLSQSCLRHFPNHWWPNLALSILEAEIGNREQANTRLTLWAAKNKTFFHYWCLAYFHYSLKDTERTLLALTNASKHALSDVEGYTWVLSSVAWRAVALAYQLKRYDIALSLCDCWEAHYEARNHSVDSSFFAFRAACYLAYAQYTKALEQLVLERTRTNLVKNWARNLDQLEQAIREQNRAFVYDPGEVMEPFPVWLKYE